MFKTAEPATGIIFSIYVLDIKQFDHFKNVCYAKSKN
jgi:hypothetical protein